MIPWLAADRDPEFPPLDTALRDPDGLLAAGGTLNAHWLLAAYRRGIFPWFSRGQPILWWSPDPRLVLRPTDIVIRRSLRKTLRNGSFTIRFDSAFDRVIEACAAPREEDAPGTWITPAIRAAYTELHTLGYAHSVEAWHEDELVGGLYGVALGPVFFGESMFTRRSDASKVCLVHLARYLEARKFIVIDCQMTTAHLLSLGANEMSRAAFAALLARSIEDTPPCGLWPVDATAGLTF